MRLSGLILGLLTASMLCSCAGTSVQRREDTAISKSVYAIHDSIEAGRFDLSKQYSDESIRLVPPPSKKDRIKINKFEVKNQSSKIPSTSNEQTIPPILSKPYVVLPSGFNESDVVVVGSDQYNILVANNTDLQKQLGKEKTEFTDYKEKNNDIIRDKDQELKELRARPGFFGTIWNFVRGFFKWGTLGVVLLGVGLLVLCILVPPTIPFVLTALRGIGAAIGAILRLLGQVIMWLVHLLEKIGKKSDGS